MEILSDNVGDSLFEGDQNCWGIRLMWLAKVGEESFGESYWVDFIQAFNERNEVRHAFR